ncbi:cytochrome c oxidase accessory protein CcoG [Suttonella sp. R2A3]|uniref:cytochrome c oxidase accessory protein CcoG n=1 Tax=Suttonella sp. R2A3 TaxID=2908648 RepID=UPI001F33B643|nr:cytochrome c oxidase accessory protein CcoG [Suttonella sp. R2A3]UJF23984.1 cytochrome c oxidase accessory protein CcoG [Suttonella sp. R2A3]
MARPQAPAYDKHVKIRPRPVKGRFQTLRKTAVVVLLLIFHALPFFQWNGRQAIWFDLANRRFYIFDLNIWPQDFILLTFILLGLALVLFFVTALLGRVWCGYACPQTVYTEVFLWIEEAVEGNRSEQLKLVRAPWSFNKIVKRVAKYGAWILVGLITGIGFVAYFYPIRQLIPDFFTGSLPLMGYFWILFYGGFCYMQAGIMREKFCKFMCPYARFQGAMFDRDTLIIAYDEERGEPRRRLKRKDRENPEDLGFCVDCTMCVQVCPTGIDIRDGLQLECIACALCIDACDGMMDQIGAPRGLIRYTSTKSLEGGTTRFLRPKTFGYGLVLSVAFTLFIFAIVTKSNVDLSIVRDRNVLSREIAGDQIQNIYNVNIMNKTERARSYVLSVSGIEGAVIDGKTEYDVGAAQVEDQTIRVNIPKASLSMPSQEILFTVTPDDDADDAVSIESKFLKL